MSAPTNFDSFIRKLERVTPAGSQAPSWLNSSLTSNTRNGFAFSADDVSDDEPDVLYLHRPAIDIAANKTSTIPPHPDDAIVDAVDDFPDAAIPLSQRVKSMEKRSASNFFDIRNVTDQPNTQQRLHRGPKRALRDLSRRLPLPGCEPVDDVDAGDPATFHASAVHIQEDIDAIDAGDEAIAKHSKLDSDSFLQSTPAPLRPAWLVKAAPPDGARTQEFQLDAPQFVRNGFAMQIARLGKRNRSETAMFLHKGIAGSDIASFSVHVQIVSAKFGVMSTLCQRIADQSLLVVYFSAELAAEQRITAGSVVQIYQPWQSISLVQAPYSAIFVTSHAEKVGDKPAPHGVSAFPPSPQCALVARTPVGARSSSSPRAVSILNLNAADGNAAVTAIVMRAVWRGTANNERNANLKLSNALPDLVPSDVAGWFVLQDQTGLCVVNISSALLSDTWRAVLLHGQGNCCMITGLKPIGSIDALSGPFASVVALLLGEQHGLRHVVVYEPSAQSDVEQVIWTSVARRRLFSADDFEESNATQSVHAIHASSIPGLQQRHDTGDAAAWEPLIEVACRSPLTLLQCMEVGKARSRVTFVARLLHMSSTNRRCEIFVTDFSICNSDGNNVAVLVNNPQIRTIVELLPVGEVLILRDVEVTCVDLQWTFILDAVTVLELPRSASASVCGFRCTQEPVVLVGGVAVLTHAVSNDLLHRIRAAPFKWRPATCSGFVGQCSLVQASGRITSVAADGPKLWYPACTNCHASVPVGHLGSSISFYCRRCGSAGSEPLALLRALLTVTLENDAPLVIACDQDALQRLCIHVALSWQLNVPQLAETIVGKKLSCRGILRDTVLTPLQIL